MKMVEVNSNNGGSGVGVAQNLLFFTCELYLRDYLYLERLSSETYKVGCVLAAYLKEMFLASFFLLTCEECGKLLYL